MNISINFLLMISYVFKRYDTYLLLLSYFSLTSLLLLSYYPLTDRGRLNVLYDADSDVT